MTSNILRKHINFIVNPKGEKVAVQLDLKNKLMRKLFEEIAQDFDDTMTVLERQDEERIPFEQIKAELLANKEAV
jgi:ribosome maturation factor RimP